MKKKLACFDLDGTLLPNTYSGFNKVQDILFKMGLPPADSELIRKSWGKPFLELAQIACRSAGAAERHPEFLEIEKKIGQKYINFCPILPGILKRVKKSAYLAIITSRDRKSFDEISKISNLHPSLFEFVQTLEDSEFKKPDPRVFSELLRWAESLNLHHSDITYFGDTVNYDLAAVQGHHKINFVGVCSGASLPHEFLSAGVADIVHGTNGLSEYLDQIYLTD